MRLDYLYDTPSITARCRVQDFLAVAAREQLIHEARKTTHRQIFIRGVGHMLVRLGQWLQAIAQPTYQEETVQW